MNTKEELRIVWNELGLSPALLEGGSWQSRSPIDGQVLASVAITPMNEANALLERSRAAFLRWREVPAPQRGELVRRFGQILREHKAALGRVVTLEVGKITTEGLGEVQEMIDIADFAVGLSRQLHGLTIASERPEHRMMEQWHPLGPVAVITAFNFPVAVWAWNAALALVCGNTVVWKPSEKAPLCALAVQGLWARCVQRYADELGANSEQRAMYDHLCQLLQGGAELGAELARDPRVALVSATGSTRMGRTVAPVVAQRFGRCLLELGGNNAVVVTQTADMDLAVRGIVFGAVGTAGQRCTTTRRLLVHESRHEELMGRLVKAYGSLRIGDPREVGVLLGPLIDEAAAAAMERALAHAREQGGTVISGGQRMRAASSAAGGAASRVPDGGVYVSPAIVDMPAQTAIVCEETFAPILYVIRWRTFDEAMAMHNAVPQGLSSAIFTRDLIEAETFISASGSDCGIANVNLGTSGAEIGGAFGGDKETGGGRESGSDAWRQYMRRATNTINRGRSLPLAQGVSFEV
jgi:aldehyde dehydrogenase (NAD+)